MSPPGPGRTRVLYVGGTGRSGSTTLANVLGEAAGLVSVGEVRFLWERGILQNRLCGCGARFAECPFWSEVLDTALGPGTAEDRAALATWVRGELQARTRMLALPGHLYAGRRHLRGPGTGALGDLLGRVYAAIAAVAHADVVVDSSKLPTYAALLGDVDAIDVQVAHLVRDPRAAAYSWRRRKQQPDLGSGALMERRGAGKSAILWSVWNRSLESLCRSRGVDYELASYEQFVAHPRREAERVLVSFGLGRPGLLDRVFADDRTVCLATNHTVAGNPSRHQQGLVSLVPDDEWRLRMRPGDRKTVTALSWPTLQRYGYRIRI